MSLGPVIEQVKERLVAEELAWFEEYSAGFVDEAEPADTEAAN